MNSAPFKEIRPLTSLRAIGALWVVFYHFDSELQFFKTAWIQAGYLGVDLFFILSGFVIAYTHAEEFAANTEKAYRPFLLARLARIYPMHILSLLTLLVMYEAARHSGIYLMPGEYTGEGFLLNLALIQSWGFIDYLSWNYPSWSISAEWFVYLCFPAAAFILRKTRSRRSAIIGWSLCWGLLVLLAGIWNDGSLNLLYGLSLPRAACGFMGGAFLWTLYRQDENPNPAWSRAAALAIVLGSVWFPFRENDAVYFPIFSLVIFAASRPVGIFGRILSSRTLVYLGKISYSLYMTHILLRKSLVRWVHLHMPGEAPLPARLLIFGLCAALAVIIGAMCYHAIEKPARNLVRRLGHIPYVPV